MCDPKVCAPTMARQDFPDGKFRFFPPRSLEEITSFVVQKVGNPSLETYVKTNVFIFWPKN